MSADRIFTPMNPRRRTQAFELKRLGAVIRKGTSPSEDEETIRQIAIGSFAGANGVDVPKRDEMDLWESRFDALPADERLEHLQFARRFYRGA